MALALFIIIVVTGIQITIFRAKWGDFFRLVYETLQELIVEFRNLDWMSLTEEKQKVKEPLTWARVKYNYAMPCLFVIVFPIFYAVMRSVDIKLHGDSNTATIVICAFIIVALVMLVLYVYGENEKNIRRKFWIELIVALFMEIGVVFDFHLLLEGYYFESARGAKSLVYSLLFIPMFLSYCGKTNRNWKALQDMKCDLPKEEAKDLYEGEHHE